MLQESEIVRKATTPGGTRYYRDQETRDIVDGHTTAMAGMASDIEGLKTICNYPPGDITWFGFKKQIGNSNSAGTPCGNITRLTRMKEILGLGGYMVKNDHSRRKLAASDHRKYADDNSAVVFTGADGHYQWGWGVDMWYGRWIEKGYIVEAFDDRPIPNHPCVKIPVGSVSASGRCAIDRTNLALCGYISDDPQFRGGSGEASWDGTWRSLLGMPVSNIPVGTLATYARKNGNMWFANERVAIFIIGALMRVYFHNTNIQAAFVEGVDEQGLHSGGLGYGIMYDGDIEWDSRGYNPYWKNSVGIEYGDFTGLLSTTITKSNGQQVSVTGIPSFMGLKNWYKSLWIMEEDSLLICTAQKTQSMYVKKIINGELSSLENVNDKVLVGNTPAHASGSWSYIKEITAKYLSGMPIEDGGSDSTFFGDGYYNPTDAEGSVRGSLRLGDASDGGYAGSCLLVGNGAPSVAHALGGAVLCEFAEAFDTELTVPSA
jgi:hypothetical protein